MAKLNAKMIQVAEEWITEHGLMQFGGALMKDYFSAMGIDPKSHYTWMQKSSEYADMVERSLELYRKNHAKKLFGTLMEAATGGWHECETDDITYRPDPSNPQKPMISKRRTQKDKRWHAPNVAAAIFLLTNLDPENFVNRQRSDVVAKVEQQPEMTMEEALAELERLERLRKSCD